MRSDSIKFINENIVNFYKKSYKLDIVDKDQSRVLKSTKY